MGHHVIRYEVPFVVGKGRPRFFRGHAVTPKATREAEMLSRLAYESAAHGAKAHTGIPVRVIVEMFSPLPKSTPKRILFLPFLTRPDLDNVSKLQLDALNGVAYVDDAQVTELHAYKRDRTRDVTKHTEVTVEWED